MPFGLICDKFHRHPKRSLVGLEVDGMLMRAISYCAEHLTDGYVPADFVDREVTKHCTVHGYGVRRAKRERMAILDALTRPLPPRQNPILHPAEGGFWVHDYLEINRSREQVESDRAKGNGRVSKHRRGKRSAEAGGCNGVTPGIGFGVPTETINGDRQQDHARPHLPALVADIQAVFAGLGLSIDEMSVANAIARFPGVPHLQVARGCAEACNANRDKPTGLTLHRWFEREAANTPTGRSKAEREADGLAAIQRVMGDAS